jgi:lipoyl(octanoyl) transferase
MRIEYPGFVPNPVEYTAGWQLQRQVHREVVALERDDTVLLLEHEPVYTAGKRTEPHERPLDGTPVVDVDRGGKITWHGPGQLVGYPILHLPDPIDVVAYVRRLEQVLIDVCAEVGLETTRVEGRSGVWVTGDPDAPLGAMDSLAQDRKVGAIGIRVAQGVTMHGFALNADCELGWAQGIVPCGIPDAGVTSITRELGRRVSVADVVPLVEKHLQAALTPAVA